MKRNSIDLFILRARRVLSHSLFTEDRPLLRDLYNGKLKLTIIKNLKTGEETQHLSARYPTEEQLESLTARIRPIILDKDQIHYSKVLTELERQVPENQISKYVERISWWRKEWKSVYDKSTATSNHSSSFQAYGLITESGTFSDTFLMDRWIYSDLIHADRLPEQSSGSSFEDRFQAAAHSIARIAVMVESTYNMLSLLNQAGLIEIEPTCLTDEVTVTELEYNREVKAFAAPLGTTPPDHIGELDNSWQSLNDIHFRDT